MSTCVELQNISKDIKKNRILNDINMTLHSGKIIGFKGINGSGKTMLMRLISGLIRPTSGIIKINGKQLGNNSEFPSSIGILIENPAFLDQYTGYQNLHILASVKGIVSDEAIKNTIHLVGLDSDDKRKYKKYSLGMKQRLGLAAAVMEEPDIIILDEPMNALDNTGIRMAKELIKNQRKRGALVIISCHDSEILNELSDEIYLLENGHLSEHYLNNNYELLESIV